MRRLPSQQSLDAQLNEIIAERDVALRYPPRDDLSTRLADLFTREAAVWGQLYEATASITAAKAAIRARQYATSEAARWRALAARAAITA